MIDDLDKLTKALKKKDIEADGTFNQALGLALPFLKQFKQEGIGSATWLFTLKSGEIVTTNEPTVYLLNLVLDSGKSSTSEPEPEPETEDEDFGEWDYTSEDA